MLEDSQSGEAMLEKFGPIYSEDLSAGMKFSAGSLERINEALKTKYESPLDFITNIEDSVLNG